MVWARKTTATFMKEKKMGAKSIGQKLKQQKYTSYTHTHTRCTVTTHMHLIVGTTTCALAHMRVCVCVWTNDHWTHMHSIAVPFVLARFALHRTSKQAGKSYASQFIQFARQNLQAHKTNHTPNHTHTHIAQAMLVLLQHALTAQRMKRNRFILEHTLVYRTFGSCKRSQKFQQTMKV